MAPDLRILTKLVDTQAVIAARIAEALAAQLRSLWTGFDGWYEDELVLTQARESASLVEAAQGRVREQTTEYMRQVYDEMEAIFPEDDLAEELPLLEFKYARHGADVEDVYQRPAREYRRMRADGWSEDVSKEAAALRATALGKIDMTLAQRNESARVLQAEPSTDEVAEQRKKPRGQRKSPATGYRRIIHPELSETGTCGLCIAAASRKYRVEELMPIHGGCKCTVLPITAAHDPGFNLNDADLERLYEAAGSTGAADLKRTRVKTVEHGEMGPVLFADGHTAITEDNPRATKARRDAIRQAKEAPAEIGPSERIAELEAKIAGAKKSIAWGENLDEDVTSRSSRAYWVVQTAQNRITRYQAEIDALRKRSAA